MREFHRNEIDRSCAISKQFRSRLCVTHCSSMRHSENCCEVQQLMTPEEFAALGVAFAKIKATVDEADAEEAAAASESGRGR